MLRVTRRKIQSSNEQCQEIFFALVWFNSIASKRSAQNFLNAPFVNFLRSDSLLKNSSTSATATEHSVARVSVRFIHSSKENRIAEWRNFRREELEDAGQHYIETFTLNTDSCFAVFT
jgi:hypothetical protein